MTDELGEFPAIEVEIKKSGALQDPGDLIKVQTLVRDNNITDLIVVSHGWNNDMQEARQLYVEIFNSMQAVANGTIDLTSHRVGVVAIFWPSKKFAEQEFVPGGGAVSVNDQADGEVSDSLNEFADALQDPSVANEIAAIHAEIENLDSKSSARELFADKIRSLLSDNHAESDDGSERFLSMSAKDLFDRLEAPFLPQAGGGGGGAAGGAMASGSNVGGGAAGLGDWFSGAKAAARRIANYATYYLMKSRAGDVGAGGVKDIINAAKQDTDVKVHLVGHSFGGRVVTAASKALGDSSGSKPDSMTLLQAAFSHNGFAEDFHKGKDGFFRSVVTSAAVDGPILVTHTHNDRANAIAYPLASRFAFQKANALGGPDDVYGAIGANGAVHTPEAEQGVLLPVGATGYSFESGKLYNLNADDFIKDHGDVDGQEVAFAILSAVTAG